jgi:hypothetical protein
MKLLDRLADPPQYLLPFLHSKLGFFFYQGKQSALEVWVDQDTLLLVAVDVHVRPMRARTIRRKSKGLVEELLGYTLEDKGLVVGPEREESERNWSKASSMESTATYSALKTLKFGFSRWRWSTSPWV